MLAINPSTGDVTRRWSPASVVEILAAPKRCEEYRDGQSRFWAALSRSTVQETVTQTRLTERLSPCSFSKQHAFLQWRDRVDVLDILRPTRLGLHDGVDPLLLKLNERQHFRRIN